MKLKNILTNALKSSESYKEFDAKKTKCITGIKGASDALLFSSISEDFEKSIVVIKDTEEEAHSLFQTLLFYDVNVCHFPDLDIIPFRDISSEPDIIHERVSILYKAAAGEKMIVVLSVKALLRLLPNEKNFKKHFFTLKKGDKIRIDDLRLNLTDIGYVIENETLETGSASVRGSIIDIFSPVYKNPVRIELFDDEIENIRLFNVETGRSFESINEAVITPVKECVYTDEMRDELISKFNIENDLKDKLLTRKYFAGYEHLLGAFYNDNVSITDYFDNALIFSSDITHITNHAKEYFSALEEAYSGEHNYNMLGSPYNLYLSKERLEKVFEKSINITPFSYGEKDEIRFSFKEGISFKGRMGEFLDYLKKHIENEYIVILATNNDEQAKRFESLTEELNPTLILSKEQKDFDTYKNKFYIIDSHINSGFVSDEMKTLFIADYEVFGRKKKHQKRIPKQNRSIIETFVDLNEGDYAVHVNYGIGIYRGLNRRIVSGKEKDYLTIEYAGGDKLFIPVEQMNFVQKYMSAGASHAPSLSKLGGAAWDKVKAKARADAEGMARELIRLYAIRSALQGHVYSKDTSWQDDFEAAFPYEETVDQLRTIAEIKSDMQSGKMMDRLVCGDVGFGKTEVAFRAAFKAVMAGKQVAILCPTTILSQQHYKNALERFKDFPIKIEIINRFRNPHETKKAEHLISVGEADIAIGTHKILSKNIKFKNLGLIIIDEEQRFGVKHKEELKRFRFETDVITLSATPIPRTLNMSLSGIRDISIIETPPLNRQPVKTFVMEYSENAVKEAIDKEIARGGQVFFLHNRIETIDRFALNIKSVCKDARIGVAHGRLSGHMLEEIMTDFIKHKYDILISTTIIENGIDIPNANTILIERADILGLSELYQLRGRVGRSDREAFAYLFYPKDKSITEDAYKRLEAIAEHTDLGSGFKIAMRDLEIRGAGNVVGKEQSGTIHQVGYELYIDLLEEAVSEYKGEIKEITFDTVIDLKHDLYIPNEYISSEKEKINVYKLILRAQNEDDLDSNEKYLVDKYGALPESVKRIIKIAYLKIFLKKRRIISVIEGTYNIYIKLNEFSHVDIKKIMSLVSSKNSGVYIDKDNLNQIILPAIEDTLEWKIEKIKDTILKIEGSGERKQSKKYTESEDKTREKMEILDIVKKQTKKAKVTKAVKKKFVKIMRKTDI